MKGNRYSKEQIIGILKEHEAGVKVAELVSQTAFRSKAFIAGRSSAVACFIC